MVSAKPEHATIAVIGAGAMGGALLRGWLSAGAVEAEQLIAVEPVECLRRQLADELGIQLTDDGATAVSAAEIVWLAVKPQVIDAVAGELAPSLKEGALVVSIAAGVPISRLQRLIGEHRPVVRVMPNTPCLVGETAAAIAAGPLATEQHVASVEALLNAVGLTVRVDEKLMDAVTGLSGSGPAFVYVFIEALADAGVRTGLPRDTALRLAAQTVLGAARMVLETGVHPGELKDRVASPAGTTIAGLHALESRGFRGAVIDAVVAAAKRSEELAGG